MQREEIAGVGPGARPCGDHNHGWECPDGFLCLAEHFQVGPCRAIVRLGRRAVCLEGS